MRGKNYEKTEEILMKVEGEESKIKVKSVVQRQCYKDWRPTDLAQRRTRRVKKIVWKK